MSSLAKDDYAIVRNLPKEPVLGQYQNVYSKYPPLACQLNKAMREGWELISVVNWRDSYVIYLQYQGIPDEQ